MDYGSDLKKELLVNLPLPVYNWLDTLYKSTGLNYNTIITLCLCNCSEKDINNYLNKN